MSTMVIKVIVITDFICSFCYIGHKELDDAIARCSDLPVKFDIQYRPFLLCGVLETPVDKGEFFRSKLKNYDEHLKSVNEAAARVGVEISLSGGVISPTIRAHRLLRKAYLLGGMDFQFPLLTSIFKAFCTDQKDIADVQVLSEIAENQGVMSKAEAIKFLESDELEEDVKKMAADAKTIGVKGVPFTLIDGKWAMSGTQSADRFCQIFRKLAATSVDGCPPPFSAPLAELLAV